MTTNSKCCLAEPKHLPRKVMQVLISAIVLTTALITGFLFSGSSCSNKIHPNHRIKRILWGQKIQDRDVGYNSVMYYAWLGMGHACWYDFWAALKFLTSAQCRVGYRNLHCSGSLIAPDIVLTAAHSLVEENYMEDWSTYTVKSEWENLIIAIVGYSSLVELPVFGIRSKRFLVHPKYSTLFSYGIVTHDYGWIVLEEEFQNGPSHSLAPVQDLTTQTKLYEIANQQLWVCLILGFGRHEQDNPEASQFLRHGWVSVNFYYDTYSAMKKILNVTTFSFNYANTATWVWMRPFGLNYASLFKGDSGGPVTCKNYHYGEGTSMVDPVRDKNPSQKPFIVSVAAPLAFIVYESSLEYRKSFLEEVYRNTERRERPTFRPPFSHP